MSYKTWFAKVPDSGGAGYSIDHTGMTYVIGRDGRYIGFFPPQTSPDRIASILRDAIGRR